ncbi:hypothetical protein EV210_103315 [Anaerospora hongkongensis]|uniref:Lysophospholipase L1-like esterase n=1 Tax=Anaerospora hongkongensis TaxID=244830 RepID=A0A4R1Q8V2_9FIRM|nr:hypothetical protein [Anaerospora hongkongensis]TCL38831.1 hypothetical protein EV210_103315 [Anaerospora hongkongensis]
MRKANSSVLLVCLLVIFTLTWAMSGLALAQENSIAPKIKDIGSQGPASMIYIGNSFFFFNNGIHRFVDGMIKEGIPGHRLRSTLVTIGGSGLDWHDVNSYFRPNAIGTYSFDSNNNLNFNDPNQKLFDVAIMIDSSQGPIHPKLENVFKEYAKKHSDTVRRYSTIPVLFMSWAYADKPEMTRQLEIAYTQAGNDNNVLVIPAGLAFANSITLRPDINLWAPDKRHPSVAGSYLAGATIYATIFKKSPVGLKYSGGLDESVARHLQEIAWDTVQEYFSR